MNEKLLVLAYMGAGKTETAQRYKNAADLDFQDYKFILGTNQEKCGINNV